MRPLIPLFVFLLPFFTFAQKPALAELQALMVENHYQEVVLKLEGQSLNLPEQIILARALRQTGKSRDALDLLEEIWLEDTSQAAVAQMLGETFYSRSQYRQAYPYFAKLCELQAENAFNQKLAGRTAARVVSLKAVAISHYQEAMRLAPEDRDAAYALASLYFELGQNLSARPLTQRFVERDSSDLGMMLLDTRIAYLLERYDHVLSNVSYELSQGDTIPSALRLYGVSLYQVQKYQESLKWLQYLAKVTASEQVYFYLGMSHYRLENFDTAAVYLQKAIEESRSDNLGDFTTQLAITLDKGGHYREALKAYHEAYELSPNNNLLFRMAIINDDELRKYEAAKELYNRYLQLTPENYSNERLYAKDRLAEMKRADFMNIEKED